ALSSESNMPHPHPSPSPTRRSSDLHGNLFASYGNGDILSASLPGGQSHDWGRQQYGGSVGGAFVPEKLFFFAALERGRQDLRPRSEEHTSELQSLTNLVCRLLLEKQ